MSPAAGTRHAAWRQFVARFKLTRFEVTRGEGNAAWQALATDGETDDRKEPRTYGLGMVQRAFLVGYHEGWSAAAGTAPRRPATARHEVVDETSAP